MRKPLNFKAAWHRNVNPDSRAASFVGLYSREHHVPVRFACRIWFWSPTEAERFANGLPRLIGGRTAAFHFPGDMARNEPGRVLGQYRVEFELSGRRGVVSPIPAAKYLRLRDRLLERGYSIDWQHDIGVPRVYRTRDAFEAALIGPVVRPDPRIPD